MPKNKSYFLDLLDQQKTSDGLQEMLELLKGHTGVASLVELGKKNLDRQDLLRKDMHLNIISEAQIAFEREKVGAGYGELLDEMVFRGIVLLEEKSGPDPEFKAKPKIKIQPEIKKILFFGANPKGTDVLNIPGELNVIKQYLQKAILSNRISIQDQLATTFEHFRNSIDEHNPNIVHFSGHGSSEKKALMMVDEFNSVHYVTDNELDRVFQLLFPKVDCVILNACSTKAIGTKIAQHVQYVIAMKDEVENMSAKSFSKGFYTALGAGKSIDLAFEKGKAEIFYKKLPDESVFILFKDGKQVKNSNSPSTNDSL